MFASFLIKKEQIIDSIENLNSSKTDDIFLISAKDIIEQITLFLQSEFVNKDNYQDLINKYYFPTLNKILSKIPNFIDKKNYNYNYDFILILEQLYTILLI